MPKIVFKKATKHKTKLRLALVGPPGSGKTWTALELAQHLVMPGEGKGPNGTAKVRLIDSERRSSEKYADKFDFETLSLESFEPRTYVDALWAAQEEDGGCDVIITDSLSHAWMGKGGALEQVDMAAKRSTSKNTFDAWRHVTPMHNELVDALLACKEHLIITLRTKTEYVVEQVDRGNGRTSSVPRKIGLQPVQRDGLEYEFDVVADMDVDNNMVIGKTRCSDIAGQVYNKPGKQFAIALRNWLSAGVEAPPEPEKPKDARSEDEKHPQYERVNREEFKTIFDKLGSSMTNRLQAGEKYKADDKLKEVLERRLKEYEAEAAKRAAAEAAKTTVPAPAPGPAQEEGPK